MTAPRTAVVAVAVMVAAAVLLVWASLDRPEPPAYAPTPPAPAEAGDTLVGPAVYTIDARDPDRWRFFDFSRGSVVEDPDPLGWDLAFRRNRIAANGGEGFLGLGGVADLGVAPFDSVGAAPTVSPSSGLPSPYVESRRDTTNAAIEDWYDYSMMSHLLTPRPRVWVVRTADGRYAKLELLSYYCAAGGGGGAGDDGADGGGSEGEGGSKGGSGGADDDGGAGCLTFRYLYQGSETAVFTR